MKYEFEIRGEFFAEAPPIAEAWKHNLVQAVANTMMKREMRGAITGHQLAMKGKLQKFRTAAPLETLDFFEPEVSVDDNTVTIVLTAYEKVGM